MNTILLMGGGRFYGYVSRVETGFDGYMGWANGPMEKVRYLKVVDSAETKEEAIAEMQDIAGMQSLRDYED